MGAAAPGGRRELSPTGKHVAYRLWRRPGPHWHVRECFPRTGGTTSPQIHARPKLRMWPNFKTGWTGVGAAPRSEGLVRSSEPHTHGGRTLTRSQRPSPQGRPAGQDTAPAAAPEIVWAREPPRGEHRPGTLDSRVCLQSCEAKALRPSRARSWVSWPRTLREEEGPEPGAAGRVHVGPGAAGTSSPLLSPPPQPLASWTSSRPFRSC